VVSPGLEVRVPSGDARGLGTADGGGQVDPLEVELDTLEHELHRLSLLGVTSVTMDLVGVEAGRFIPVLVTFDLMEVGLVKGRIGALGAAVLGLVKGGGSVPLERRC
jgi:hypothetical protein